MAKTLTPLLRQVWRAKTWKTRDRSIAKAYSAMAQRHNALKITKPLATNTCDYYRRPYSVIYGERFAKAIKQEIKDPKIKRIKTNVGSIDQFTDSTDVVENLGLCKKLRAVYK
jgi:hypothetical protein